MPIIFLLLSCICTLNAQALLSADGEGLTYELISSVLAPGYNPIEHPECIHPEFGRHITEVFDSTLNKYVFEFFIHVTPDNDRCKNFDRQRVEIKTYDQSPDSLLGIVGETIEYKWKFKLPSGFQPSSSFTHIHQIKAVGGNDANPIFTLTPRKGNPDVIELIHDNATKMRQIDLSLFINNWVECTEVIYLHPTLGNYSLHILNIADESVILEYSSDSLMTIRPDNEFCRPKWGIYRSLNNSSQLRDEAVKFADFSIKEIKLTGFNEYQSFFSNSFILEQNYPNPFNGETSIIFSLKEDGIATLKIYDILGREVRTLLNENKSKGEYQCSFNAQDLSSGIYYYTLWSNKYFRTRKMILLK